MKADEKIQNIIQWRESISSLPEKFFFELVHIYLGEVKTPYNKQKLAERLGGILRDESNRKTILNFLSADDAEILSAINFMEKPTSEKLERFFSADFPQGIFYNILASLEERLVIYFVPDEISGKKIIRINPYLADDLAEIFDFSSLIPSEKKIEFPPEKNLSAEVAAVFVSYVSLHPDFCKIDGGIKKRCARDLHEIFHGNFSAEFFETLFSAMKNLLLFKCDADGNFSADWNALENFSLLSAENQAAYFCASSACGFFSRRKIAFAAELFLHLREFLCGGIYSAENAVKAAFLLAEKIFPDGIQCGRFSKIVSGEDDDGDFLTGKFIKKILHSAANLGVLNFFADDGKEFFSARKISAEENSKKISIDAGFRITIFPGFSLSEILPFVKFSRAAECDVAAIFEITKQSALDSFAAGFGREKIAEILEKFSGYRIPQGLSVSLEEWDADFSSSAIFKGYVLKTDVQKFSFLQKNPAFKSRVKFVLADGVFLMDFSNDAEAENFAKKFGLDGATKIRGNPEKKNFLSLPEIRRKNTGGKFSMTDENPAEKNKFVPLSKIEMEKIKKNFREKLSSMNLTQDQKDGLEDRIARRVILSAEQLRGESVKFELTEAGGMNFSGKIHILESAAKNGNFVEVEISAGRENFVGKPESIFKKGDDTVLKILQKNPSSEESIEREIVVALISKVKKIRSSTSLLDLK